MTVGSAQGRRYLRMAWVLVPAALLLVAAANVHLVYVAVMSQPDCVPHLKETGKNGGYRAAKPAC